MSLRDDLVDWTDWDWAAHILAQSLGLMEASPSSYGHAKHVYWSNHPVGNALYKALDAFVAAGFLERREEPDVQYRWRPDFRGSWEKGTSDE
jgi:hypothetical protein